jgi:UDP-N-acetylglucosamine acyltransferase
VRIGAGVTFREGVTVNRATTEGAFTEIGDSCFLMANSHVGHDCVVCANVILANGVLLAGKVTIGAHTFMGGGAVVHQYCRVGESAMVSGMSRVGQDAPPYCMVAERNELIGLNLVGLQRRGFSREVIRELKQLFHLVFGAGGNPRLLAEGALGDGFSGSVQGRQFLQFLSTQSKRGIMRPRGSSE